MRKNCRKMLQVAEWMITILIVAVSIYCIVGVYTQGKDFYVFGYKPVVVLSGSMEPYLETNSLVIIQKTKQVDENDVVMFLTDEGSTVCHRIININKNGEITTKGDNNDVQDFEKITKDNIQGRVVLRMNFLSKLIGLIR